MAKFAIEREIYAQGFLAIAGVDEVGRGCLAGPVVAGAVILNPERIPKGIKDSKLLSALQREKLSVEIKETALAFAIGVGEVDEIDTINILNASKLAMIRAIDALLHRPDFLLLDGNFKISYALPQRPVVKGDQLSASIGAAAIIAKVFRDEMMRNFDSRFPGYLFAENKGYGSEVHRKALMEKGPCAIHRKSFSWTPVRSPSESTVS